MNFPMYQMDVKSAFIYGTIEEEVYVCQPLGFVDPEFLEKVYKVEKALYGLHQAPRAWYETLSTYLLDNGFHRGQIDKTLFIKRLKGDILLIMHNRFQMSSMGELTFFLGLQVKQKEDGIFISQDKYVGEILKKFGFSSIRTASTPMETNKALTKDEDGEDVDVHLYRSMIGSLMYLTSSRPDIMFSVCACSRFQVQPKVSHLNAVKRIFRYLKGQPKLGLWYPKDSPLILEAFSDSDYAGASLDRKSTTGGCQFLGSRLISWQCKKQTVVANSTTEAEYIAASHCCGQVLWIQNQMLDYGFNFMQTKIHVDNESAICVVKNPVYHSKTKHIEIRHHFIRDSYEKRLIEMVKIHTDNNVADLLTKAFDVSRFNFLVASIGKRGRDTKIPQSSGPPIKVGDVAVHKELGDRMERAATTASSFEAEQDSDAQTRFEAASKSPMTHLSQELTHLEVGRTKSEGSVGFHQIIDFLNARHIQYALTENPTIYVSFIKQFWRTTTAGTSANREVELTATIDGQVKTITEASLRRHLKLEDNGGVTTLPNSEIFEQLALMGSYSGIAFALFPTMSSATETSPSRITSSPSLSPQHTPISTSSTSQPPNTQPTPDAEESLETELKETKQTYNSALTQLIRRVKKLEQIVKASKSRRRQLGVFSAATSLTDAAKRRRSVETAQTYTRRRISVSTSSGRVSNASRTVSTAGVKAKDKGKAIMQESVPSKKVKKRVQVQMSMDEELAKKVFEEEQAKAMAEQEQERINFEAALELQKQLDEREEVAAEPTQAQQIDWSDPAVLRYHAQLNRPYSVAEVRKNMVMYLKNQGGYKMNYFKGMKYEDIRPIFEKVWDQIQSFAPMDSEKEKDSEKKGSRKKSLARKRAGEKQSEESTKRQKIEDDVEKEELKAYLDLVPREEFAMEIESLATKYPIVDWKTHVLTENFMYYQIFRADGSSKNYKIFSEMLDDFDRQDVLDLHRLVKARYMTSSPEGYDLMLWGDLKILFEPDEEDEVWRNQHEYNLISWRLFDSCGIHILLMNNGIAIHMMIEKKYPLTQEMLSKMLSRKLEVDHENEMAFELLRDGLIGYLQGQKTLGISLEDAFIKGIVRPSKTVNQLEEIHNFKHKGDETLYQAWERADPWNDNNRELESIQNMTDHSQKWHDEFSNRRTSSGNLDGIAVITSKLDSLRCDM
ncbi:putative ribonuclease H-like domain-containing protein [Tanacetum coccineum]